MDYIIKTQKDGSTVTIRDVQCILLDMMKDIDIVLKKHHIDYFLASGSTLGAIRHQGFIPWDDDLDIGIRDTDYQRFIKAMEDLPEQYTFHCFEKDRRFIVTWPFMKIRKKNTYIKEMNVLLKNKCTDCEGLFIDVFLYQHVSKSNLLDLPLRLINTLLTPIIIFFENIHINPLPLKHLFRFNASFYSYLCRHSDYVGQSLTWTFQSPLKPYRCKESDIWPTKMVPFEDTFFPIPCHEKPYLETFYGPHYMTPPPENKRFAKHTKDINLHGPKPM